jgi:hypothetical protein
MLKRIVLALLLLVITGGAEAARVRRPAPIRVRMVAYIGGKVEGTRPDFTWPVSYRGKRYELYVLKLVVLGGRATPLDINAAVAPYSVKFQIAGDKQAIERFLATPPRQQVVIMGYMRLDAARLFMLDSVDAGPAPTPAASP